MEICDSLLDKKHHLPVASVICGNDIETELIASKVSKDNCFCKQVKEHFLAALKHLLHKFSLKIKHVLSNLKCLHPKFRKVISRDADIIFIAKSLINISIDFLYNEWLMLEFEYDIIFYSGVRIDQYWAQFLSLWTDGDDKKYPNV